MSMFSFFDVIYGKIHQNVYSEQYWNNRLPQIIDPLTFGVKEKN